MMEIHNSETLQRWLLESGHLAPLWDRPRFVFDAEEFNGELAGVREQYPQFTDEEAEARAALRLIGKEEGRGRGGARTVAAGNGPAARGWNRRERLLLALLILAALIALLLAVPRAHAQSRAAGFERRDAVPEAAFERYRFYNSLLAARPAAAGYPAGLFGLARGPYRAGLFGLARGPYRAGLFGLARGPYRAGLFGLARGPYRADQYLQGGQPGGIIIQLANSGTVLATTPAGLLQFNCAGGMSCSFAAGSGGSPPTFTLTSTGGGGGSGCIPPGSTANALLFDAGSGACSDVAKFTWNSGANTLAGLTGATLDLSALSLVKFRVGAGLTTSANGDCGYDSTAGRWHCWQGGADRLMIAATNAGASGQPCLSNADGSCTFGDPVVSGPDARGAAQSRNPVAGLAGLDYGTGCSGGPCVQEAKVDASGNQYVNVANTVPVSGTFWQTTQPVSLASLPALAAGANDIGSVDQHGSWNVGISGTLPGFASTPTVNSAQSGAWTVTQSGTWTVQQGGAPWSVTQSSGPWTVNQTQIAGTNLVADPCQTAAKTSLPINQATASLTTIISGVSGKHTYICSIFLISAAAQNINLVAGTGTNCGTAVHVGFFGGTSAATGPNLAANTGFTLGNGRGSVAGGNDTAADNICYAASGAGQVSGVLTYVQQ